VEGVPSSKIRMALAEAHASLRHGGDDKHPAHAFGVLF
jgi:hypothetical protein